MTPGELKKCAIYASVLNCNRYAQHLTDAADEFGITTDLAAAHWLAQLIHESSSFSTTVEYASGGAYEGRLDLGNDELGDGVKYKGHGLIQVTGKANHFAAADYFRVPREQIVEWLQSPEGATRSAGWFWQKHNLNVLAEADNIEAVTKVINGGCIGLAERKMRLAEVRRGLGIA